MNNDNKNITINERLAVTKVKCICQTWERRSEWSTFPTILVLLEFAQMGTETSIRALKAKSSQHTANPCLLSSSYVHTTFTMSDTSFIFKIIKYDHHIERRTKYSATLLGNEYSITSWWRSCTIMFISMELADWKYEDTTPIYKCQYLFGGKRLRSGWQRNNPAEREQLIFLCSFVTLPHVRIWPNPITDGGEVNDWWRLWNENIKNRHIPPSNCYCEHQIDDSLGRVITTILAQRITLFLTEEKPLLTVLKTPKDGFFVSTFFPSLIQLIFISFLGMKNMERKRYKNETDLDMLRWTRHQNQASVRNPIFDPQDQETDEIYELLERRSTHFEAVKRSVGKCDTTNWARFK